MPSRIIDLTTASAIENDDYVVIDGSTEGTRKVLVSDIGGGDNMIDFEASLTPSVDSRGVSSYGIQVTPVSMADVTASSVSKVYAYLVGTAGNAGNIYPLITVNVYLSTSVFYVYLKNLMGSTQSTSTAYVSGTLHVVAPFEIRSVTGTM